MATTQRPIPLLALDVTPIEDIARSRNIRAMIHRMSRPRDVLASWRAAFDEWIEDVGVFREAENDNFMQPAELDPHHCRYHRMILHFLMARGEQLAISLLEQENIDDTERGRQLEAVEAFLDNLKVTMVAFHRSVDSAEDDSLLAKYF